MKNKLRKINYPLLLGVIIVIYLILMSLYPQKFTVRDPVYEEKPKYVQVEENGEKKDKLMTNPMPPNEQNICGTDDGGRDVYARLVYGTKNTMKLGLFIALLRMLIALPLGVAAGMGSKITSNIIKIFNTFFTAIPMLILSFIILNIGYFKSMQIDEAIIAFTIVLTIVGWAKLAGMLEDSTRLIMDEDFIEGEVAIGKTKIQIAFQNVLPHIIPTSISLFFKEIGLALFLVAQLAVFNVFVGVTRIPGSLSFRGNYAMNLEPEWGGSLSRISQNVKAFENVSWMVIFPVLAFTIAIIGFNLIGEGLRIEFQKRDSRVISTIKKITYALSPKVLVYQFKNIKKYYKPVILKVSAVALIVAYIAIPWHPSKYEFDIDGAKGHLKELTDVKYQGRAAGTEGGNMAGDYIINELKSYGYEVSVEEIPIQYTPQFNSVTGNVSVKNVDMLLPMIIENATIKIKNEGGEEKVFNLNDDFTIMTVQKDIFKIKDQEKLSYSGVAATVDKAGKIENDEGFFYISNQIMNVSGFGVVDQNVVSLGGGKSKAFDIMFMLGEGYESQHNPALYNFTSIIPFGELSKELEKGFVDMEITMDFPKVAEYKGRNIIAKLPGKDKTLEEPGKVICIGAAYDGVYDKTGEQEHVMTATPAAIGLQLAKEVSEIEEPLNNTVQFIFWDNENDNSRFALNGGSYYYAIQDSMGINMALQHGYYYFDIGYPGSKSDKKLNLSTFPAQMIDSNNYLMGLEVQNRLSEMGVRYKRFFYNFSMNNAVYNMKTNALSTVALGNPTTWGVNSPKDNLGNVNYKRMEDIGQIILDTLTMNKYMLKID